MKHYIENYNHHAHKRSWIQEKNAPEKEAIVEKLWNGTSGWGGENSLRLNADYHVLEQQCSIGM